MPVARSLPRAVVAAGAVAAFAFGGTAYAGHPGHRTPAAKSDVSPNPLDVTDVADLPERLIGGQHGGSAGHLPSKRENVELVGKLELTGQFGNVLPEQIADLYRSLGTPRT